MTMPVTIVRAGEIDNGYGGIGVDWDAAERTDVLGWLNSVTSTEVLDGRDTLISNWKLYVPAGTDITGRDRVEVDGATYLVVGKPSTASTPRGTHHVEANLIWIEG